MSDEHNFYHPTCYLHPAWKRQRNEVKISRSFPNEL